MADCVSKLVVKSKNNGFVEVPCGYCICCRKRKAAALKRLCEYVIRKTKTFQML